jgi:hypothetical protein
VNADFRSESQNIALCAPSVAFTAALEREVEAVHDVVFLMAPAASVRAVLPYGEETM